MKEERARSAATAWGEEAKQRSPCWLPRPLVTWIQTTRALRAQWASSQKEKEGRRVEGWKGGRRGLRRRQVGLNGKKRGGETRLQEVGEGGGDDKRTTASCASALPAGGVDSGLMLVKPSQEARVVGCSREGGSG